MPVYQKWKDGATRQEIMIKRVTGDKRLLVEELKEKLEVPEGKIKLNPTTGAIILTVRDHFDVHGGKVLTDLGALL